MNQSVSISDEMAETMRRLGMAKSAPVKTVTVVKETDEPAEPVEPDSDEASCVLTQEPQEGPYGAVIPVFDKKWIEPTWASILKYSITDPDEHGALLFGPRGTGKTMGVQQVCHGLQKPIVVMQCARGKGLEALIGQWTATDGTTKWSDGPLVRALMADCPLVCEEANMMAEAVWSETNTLLDGSGHKENLPDGRRLGAGPGFRLVLCFNPSYAGCKGVNESLKDRLMPIYTEYMADHAEAQILMSNVPELPEYIAESMVKIATAVRATANTNRFDMSIRCLTRWARLATKMSLSWEESWKYAVLDLIGDPVTYKVQRDTIDNIGRMEFEAWAQL